MSDTYLEAQGDRVSCEDCKFYKMIDSGYGWCIAMPPQYYKSTKTWWFIGIKEGIECDYPQVEWNRLACGQFKKKEI